VAACRKLAGLKIPVVWRKTRTPTSALFGLNGIERAERAPDHQHQYGDADDALAADLVEELGQIRRSLPAVAVGLDGLNHVLLS